MRVLCCLDGHNSQEISQAITTLQPMKKLTLGLLYVLDESPTRELERQRGLSLEEPPTTGAIRQKESQQLKVQQMHDILAEGQRTLPMAQVLQRSGLPEHEIVLEAAAWKADLILLCARSAQTPILIGPRALGHVARFVVEHAPCSVLLLRSFRQPVQLPVPTP
ncbi:universal stress protein [Tengunoibacter tsumagoiensis]|uniref:UspA domain-containing protein n=1 Tax=Tengunoibacter tsumagoiensis TaxID=2014871 RepID=A0A402A0L8_9CHLR|nr:universal stress protein [Tengunoibacter tsumagoiensis]GCE12690.1 hypothetical protein KTT_25490 [Tengunoibacter tsumagoiensis]